MSSTIRSDAAARCVAATQAWVPLAMIGLAFILTVFVPSGATRAELPAPDRSMSPYFDVRGDELDAAALLLKSTRADVMISGVIANVRVTQTYENTGDSTLEAIYMFPASTRATVFGVQLTIGERTIVAKLHKTADSRAKDETAKSAAKSATLLEQQRPNLFQVSVGNLMPGDIINVEMDYVEMLVPTEGSYQFVYPAAVGARFTRETDSSADSDEPSHLFSFWTAKPYVPAGSPTSYSSDVRVNLDAGMPIQSLTSTSHTIDPTFNDGRETASVTLKTVAESARQDVVLTYSLLGDGIASGLVLYDPELDGGSADDEKFFLAMIQPPRRVDPALMPKREYIFILDVSRSMGGFPLDAASETMRGLLEGMDATDRFNVMFFSGASKVLFPESAPVTPDTVAKADAMLAQARGAGGTRILAALEQALAMPTPDDFSRTVVVVTDGFVAVDDTVFPTIRNHIGRANLFAFGIGKSVNRHVIEGMARAGLGEPFWVTDSADARPAAKRFETYLKYPVLTDVRIKYRRFKAYDRLPETQPDVFASRPVVMIGKYTKPSGIVRLKGATGRNSYERELDVANYRARAGKNEALKYLWARRKVQALEDLRSVSKSAERDAEVAELGLKYGLVTSQTGFVAVDSLARDKTGKSVVNNQPLQLPAGVGNTTSRLDDDNADLGLGGGATGKPGSAHSAGGEAGAKAATRSLVRVEVLTIVARAPIDRKRLRSSIYQVQGALGQCIEAHAGRAGPRAGALGIELVFGRNGTVTSARLLAGADDTVSPEAAECIIALLKSVTVGRDMPTTGSANVQLKVSL